jgi:hypothetical protein
VVVSHDQVFCESLGDFTHVATVSNGRFVLEERTLQSSDWNEFESPLEDTNDTTSAKEVAGDRTLQKQAYNAPKRIEKLESLMEDLEIKVAAIDEEMLTNGSNVEKLMQLSEQKMALEAKIDDYMHEWEELEELLMTIT